MYIVGFEFDGRRRNMWFWNLSESRAEMMNKSVVLSSPIIQYLLAWFNF